MTNKQMAERVAEKLLDCAHFMESSMENVAEAIDLFGSGGLKCDIITGQMRGFVQSLYDFPDDFPDDIIDDTLFLHSDVKSPTDFSAKYRHWLSDKQVDWEALVINMTHWREDYINICSDALEAFGVLISSTESIGYKAGEKLLNIVKELYTGGDSKQYSAEFLDKLRASIDKDWGCKELSPEELVDKYSPYLRTDIL